MGKRKKTQEAPPVKVRRYRDWTILRRIFAFVFPYKWEVIKLVFLSIVNSLLGLAYPVGVMFIISELTATYDYTTEQFVSDPARFTNVLIVGLGLLGVMILAFYLKKTYIYKMSFLGQSAMLDIRRSLFDNLQILSLNYYVERPAGKIMSSVTNDVDAVSNLISNAIIQIVGDVFTVVSSIVAMLLISFTLSITILVLIPVGFIIMFFFAKKSREYFRKSRETISNITSNLQETISGSRTIKAFVTEDENIETFKELNEADRMVNLSAARMNAFVGPIVQVLIVWQ
jgi:ABC-type multidrug transport system fused ATPase/permease subunit